MYMNLKYEQLLEKGQFDLLIKLTENATNHEDVYYHVVALNDAGRVNDALEYISLYQDILDQDIKNIMMFHISILLDLAKYEQAREAYEHYANLPYQSQEVEELLKIVPQYITKKELEKDINGVYFNEENIHKFFMSENEEEVFEGLNALKNRNPEDFIYEFKHIMVNYPRALARLLALSILVKYRYEGMVEFVDIKNVKRTIKPSEVADSPFDDKPFLDAIDRIEHIKDASIGGYAKDILVMFMIAIYLSDLKYSSNILFLASYSLARDLFKEEYDLHKEAEEEKVNLYEVTELIDLMRENLI